MSKLPSEIALPVYGTPWQVGYQTAFFSTRSLLLETGEKQLSYIGKSNKDLIHQKLQGFVSLKAREYLTLRLQHWSIHCNMPFRRLRFGTQKTRWGSCTSHHSISLNEKLIFLPQELIDYVLVHELAHTIELNHSANFWLLVEQYLSDYRQHLMALKKVEIPGWFSRNR